MSKYANRSRRFEMRRRRTESGLAGSRRVGVALTTFLLFALTASLTQGSPTGRAQDGADPYPGSYEGEAWKGRLAVLIDSEHYPRKLTGGLEALKPLKSKCGPVDFYDPTIDRIENGRLSFRDTIKQDSGTKETYALKGEFKDGGRRFEGTLRHKFLDGASGDRCKAKTPFAAKLKRADVLTPWDAGHYTGKTSAPDDQPIAFDVSFDPATKGGQISNLKWDVGPMNCLDPYTDPLERATITGHYSISGPIRPEGRFTFKFPTPDPGIETDLAFGDVLRGEATGSLHVSEYFDADGTPNPQGRFLCSSLGTPWEGEPPTFKAKRQG